MAPDSCQGKVRTVYISLPGTTVFSVSLCVLMLGLARPGQAWPGLFPSALYHTIDSIGPKVYIIHDHTPSLLSLSHHFEFVHLSLTHTTTCLYLDAHMHTPHTITHHTPSHTTVPGGHRSKKDLQMLSLVWWRHIRKTHDQTK